MSTRAHVHLFFLMNGSRTSILLFDIFSADAVNYANNAQINNIRKLTTKQKLSAIKHLLSGNAAIGNVEYFYLINFQSGFFN